MKRKEKKQGWRTKAAKLASLDKVVKVFAGGTPAKDVLMQEYNETQEQTAPGRKAEATTAPGKKKPTVDVKNIGKAFVAAQTLHVSVRLGVKRSLLKLVLDSHPTYSREKLRGISCGFEGLGRKMYNTVKNSIAPKSGGNPGLVRPKGSRKLIKLGQDIGKGRSSKDIKQDIATAFERNSEPAPVCRNSHRGTSGRGSLRRVPRWAFPMFRGYLLNAVRVQRVFQPYGGDLIAWRCFVVGCGCMF